MTFGSKGLAGLMLAPLLLASCAGADGYAQGPLQPQSVSGPCQVERFFLIGQRPTKTTMTITKSAAACTFTLINPALNAVVDAALLTGAPQHGRAQASVVNGARQVAVSYAPAPGYSGTDQFDVTLEPGAVGVTVAVVIQPAS